MDYVKKALEIAKKAHKGQFRRDGKTPYIEHPIAVALKFNNYPLVEQTALLHDVIEDSDISIAYLKQEGFCDVVLYWLYLLTKKSGQSYLDYILNIKKADYWVNRIKIEDIKHNLSTLESNNKTMRAKYELALYILEH